HDDEVLTIELDFSAGVLTKQDSVAIFYVERTNLAVFIDLALADGNDFALLRLFFGRVGDDDATAGGLALFNATDQNAVMEGSEFRHGADSFQVVYEIGLDRDYPVRLFKYGAGRLLLAVAPIEC